MLNFSSNQHVGRVKPINLFSKKKILYPQFSSIMRCQEALKHVISSISGITEILIIISYQGYDNTLRFFL